MNSLKNISGTIKLFTAVIYGFTRFNVQARVFVPGKPFQPSLIFESEAGKYPSEAPFRYITLG